MSKLIEALKANGGSPQPMGFKSARDIAAKPKLLIIASLSDVTASRLADTLDGASALLVTADLKSPQLKTVAEAAGSIPWGCSLESQSADKLAPAIKAGADFITFSAGTPLKILPGRDTGRVLEVTGEAAEKLPRAVNDSPVDAVYLVGARGSETLTWQHLLLTRALSSWLSKPLLVSVPETANRDELQALWDAGATGIVAPAQPDGNIAQLRKIADKLDYPARHPAEKQAAVLPSMGLSQSSTDDTEEDEDW